MANPRTISETSRTILSVAQLSWNICPIVPTHGTTTWWWNNGLVSMVGHQISLVEQEEDQLIVLRSDHMRKTMITAKLRCLQSTWAGKDWSSNE